MIEKAKKFIREKGTYLPVNLIESYIECDSDSQIYNENNYQIRPKPEKKSENKHGHQIIFIDSYHYKKKIRKSTLWLEKCQLKCHKSIFTQQSLVIVIFRS